MAGLRDRLPLWLRPAVFLGRNPISLAGAVLTSSAALTLLAFWAYLILQAGPIQPYTGIVFFLILPGVFVLGLVLLPLGALLRRRRLRRQGTLPAVYPSVDLADPLLRRAAALVAGLTLVNIAIMGTASYKGVQYMDSTQFCGQACHTVMEPEYTAYQSSPHARVACAECHIGAGAPWFVRAKISGVRQLLAVALKTYHRPIPTPVENLRPARDTCEHCHWPQRFTGDRLLIRTSYGDDEKNTPSTTVLLMKIGGRTADGLTGIHGRHLDAGERIRYVSTDGPRQVIPRVTYLDDDGKEVEYVSTDVKTTPEELAKAEHRTMDCVDCHNRPTHTYQLPERAVDQDLSLGAISPDLPFIKKQAVAALRADYPDRATATQAIPKALLDFYRSQYPQTYQEHRAAVETAAGRVRDIYLRNVFPAMKITWGTYPNNLGHQDFLGCFRCHDGNHEAKDGRSITNDCSACHEILAMEEQNPKILADLGLK